MNAGLCDSSQTYGPWLESERHRTMTAEAAYFYALRRGFEPGHELEDWLAAEAELERREARGALPIDLTFPGPLLSPCPLSPS